MMSDFKSKLPDMKELGEITSKLFKDIKTSVSEIIHTYQMKRSETTNTENGTTKTTESVIITTEEVVKKEPKKAKVEDISKADEKH